MTKGLVLIHTVSPLLSVFDRLADEMLPGMRVMHVLDEPLLEQIKRRGHLAAEDSERVRAHVLLAERIGAEAVLVTCSTISPCVDDLQASVGIRVCKIDDAMIEKAVSIGRRIGVIATNATTLRPSRMLLEREAEKLGKDIDVRLHLVAGALPALLSGDQATHDRLVKEAVQEIMPRSDVVVLAQATMACALDTMPEAEREVPVLASPRLALERIRLMLKDDRVLRALS